jgi:Cys-tRNA(Pro) deacylase
MGTLGPDDVRRLIAEKGLEAQVLSVGEGHTSSRAADSLDIDLSEVAKTVVFVDEGRKPVLAIVRGSVKIRQGEFAKKVGARKLRLATRDEVLKLTGFPAGGVSPIGNRCHEKIYMDRTLMEKEVVFAGGGSEKHILKVRPADVLRESGAVLMDIPVQEAISPK